MSKKEAIDLVEYMEVQIEINCQGRNCEKSDGAWGEDEFEFAKDLWKKGWRISRQGTLYCPSCSKKHLKNNSK
jgi:hypothetical protein